MPAPASVRSGEAAIQYMVTALVLLAAVVIDAVSRRARPAAAR